MNAKKNISSKKLMDPATNTSATHSNSKPCIPVKYIIESILKITKYRKNIIEQNIRNAGLSIPVSNVYDSMSRSFYQVLSSSIHSSVDIQQCKNNIDDTNGIKVLLLGHLGDWESIGRRIAQEAAHETYAVYHPLSNNWLNKWINKRRIAFNLKVIPSRLFIRHMISSHRENKSVNYIILADQRPYRITNAPLFSFLGRPIAVNLYLDHLCKKYPIHFSYVRQNSNYIELIPLDTKGSSLTKQFFALLEEDIIQNPAQYLWSHRRWKTR